MLTDMLAKGKATKADEEVRYAEFKAFCENTLRQKQTSIDEGNDNIEQLQATVEKAVSDVKVMVKRIASLDNDVATWKNDVKVATKKRKEEHNLFQKTHLEYQESLEAIERALNYLSKPGKEGEAFAQLDREGMLGASLLQLSSSTKIRERQRQGLGVSAKQRQLLKSLLNARGDARKALIQMAEQEGMFEDAEEAATAAQAEEAEERSEKSTSNAKASSDLDAESSADSGAPEAKAWESSSGGIINIVEELGDKFENEKIELEKREANQIFAHQLMIKDLNDQIKAAEQASGKKVREKQQTQGAKAESEGEMKDTQASVAEDELFVKDLNAECEAKAWDFQEKQKVRKGEIDALGKALEIMKETVSKAGLVQLSSRSRRTALAQLRSIYVYETSERKKAANFLRQRARQMNSKLLMLLAQKASVDPFGKVKKMINDMIVKLLESGNEEAEHKAYCDAELQTNQQTRESKAADAEGIKANIEEIEADISKLSDEITALNQDIVDIDAAVAKATADRDSEKAKNTATYKDATIAGQATAKALEVLKDFYNKAANPAAQPAPQQGPIKYNDRALAILKTEIGGSAAGDQPEQKRTGYTGQDNGGVLGLLEVIESDFSKLAAETQGSEQEAVREYERFMADSEQSKAVKTQDLKHRTNDRTSKEVAHGELKKNLRFIHEELDAALKYYDKLKPDCEQSGPSYEERVEQRKKEIESLQEALQILAGDAIP